MHQSFDEFISTYARRLCTNGVRLIILPQVVEELRINTLSEKEETRRSAEKALAFLKKNRSNSLLQFTSEEEDVAMADVAFCRLFFHHYKHRNQVLLTCDGKLMSSIYNLCCTRDASDETYTIAFTLNDKGSPFTASGDYLKLKELSPLVEFPSSMIRPASEADSLHKNCFVEPDKANYFRDALANGIVYMCRDSLEHLFAHEQCTAFLQRAEELGVTIYVVAPSLTHELWMQMEPWMHLFHIIYPTDSSMNEEDALLDALYTSPFIGKGLHHLLITQSAELHSRIRSRRPRCYHTLQLWGVCLTEEGGFKRTALVPRPDWLHECPATSSYSAAALLAA